MPESLFAPRKFRRGYLVACFVGALSIEASLIGVGAVFAGLRSYKVEIPTTEIDTGPVIGDPVQELILPMEDPVPTPDMPTPPPEDTPEPPDDTPPPPDDMDMTLDTPKPTATPSNKPKTTFVRPPGTPDPNAKRGPVPQNGVVGGVPHAEKTAGTPGAKALGPRVVTKGVTPKPPYPAQARALHIGGNGMCHVTFDASGRVSSASMTSSTGNGLLDSSTLSFARANWSGTPNGSLNVPITYTKP